MSFEERLERRAYSAEGAALRLIPCPACHADVGEPCQTASGAPISPFVKWHRARFEAQSQVEYVRDAYGYPTGVKQ